MFFTLFDILFSIQHIPMFAVCGTDDDQNLMSHKQQRIFCPETLYTQETT